MTYKCLECGHIFEEGEQAHWREDRGEYWGYACSEKMSGCPRCKGAYIETTPCALCGSSHIEDELNGGVCDECIDKYRKNFETCYNISFGETCMIEINALLASLFEPSDIEAILIKYIKDKCQNVDLSEFIDSNPFWFGKKLIEEVKKNENSKG